VLVASAIDTLARQIAPQCRIKHPEVNPHARVGRIRRSPVRSAATHGTMPWVERTIPLLIRDDLPRRRYGRRTAMVPEPGGAPAY
jgi:hypothetical protein